MDDATATFTSDTAPMNRRSLLEQMAIIHSLFRKESSADDDAATAVARNRNVVEGRAREGVRLINDQMAAVSTELLLTVMSDMMLLRLLDGLGLEGGRAVASSNAASDEQLMLMDDAKAASATKKKKRAAAAAAKKKRNKRNKAAAKHKKTKLMSLLGGGLISLIMMIAFGSITMLIFPLSLIHPSDGSGEGGAPPALRPSASKSLHQKDHQSNNDESVSSDIDIISPLPAVAVVPPSIFSPTVFSNRRMKSDELRASSTCFDTPGWKDVDGNDCYSHSYFCDIWAGNMGSARQHCCICGGGSHSLPPTNSPTISNSPSHSLPPTNSPTISNSPTKSAAPSSSPLSTPSSSPTKSAAPSFSSKPSSSPTKSAAPSFSSKPSSWTYTFPDNNVMSGEIKEFGAHDTGIFLACINGLCCIVVLCLYLVNKYNNRGNALTMSTERRLEEDDNYALSRIGRDSVYSYFVTVSKIGWLAALTTLGTQFGILTFFLNSAKSSASEVKSANLTGAGWFIFSLLTAVFLAKDVISGFKLVYHSSRVRHPLKSRIRYFIGGTGLCSIAGFTLYVSILYNAGTSKSNTDLIVNSVIIHFVMEMDERVFSALAASNEKWTAHAADSEDSSSEAEKEKGGVIDEMEDKIALQDAQIADQQKEMGILRSQQEELMLQVEEMRRQSDDITMLHEAVKKLNDPQAGAAAAAASEFMPQCAESSDSGAEMGGKIEKMKDSGADMGGEIEKLNKTVASQQAELGILCSQQEQEEHTVMLEAAVQKMQEAQSAVAAASSESESIPQCSANVNMTMLAAESGDTISDTDTGKGDK